MSWTGFKKISVALIIASAILAAGMTSANEKAEFKTNPNKLPSCTILGHNRLKWNNCWGKFYSLDLRPLGQDADAYDFWDFISSEGEWKNGKMEN